MRPRGAWLAAIIVRVSLWLYPPSFRREMGEHMTSDARRRASELSGGRLALAASLARLSASLVANAFGAWTDTRRTKGKSGSFSWLDVKLGLRMLVKSPGLTLAGGLGIAVAIAIAGGAFTFAQSYLYPTIPLPDGDRLVGLENWDVSTHNENRRSIHDYYIWREEMQSVEDMSAFTDVEETLVGADGTAEAVRVARMTPAGFELAQVPPLLGRTLVEADVDPGAPPVIVIGHDVWRTRFAADPDIVGTSIRLGDVPHEVVGVMPEGFAFPMEHAYWVPLKAKPSDFPIGQGPSVFISARLAPGYDLEAARAELAVIGARMAAQFPETHGQFRTQVMKYVYPLLDVNQRAGDDVLGQVVTLSGLLILVLIVVCLNVAVLVYARSATRQGEIAVRRALGASRLRIVGQTFVEMLVLCGIAAALGVLILKVGLSQAEMILATEQGQPFWARLGLSVPGIAYVVFLTLLAAAITGVLPGLQATGRDVQQSLSRFNNRNGPRLGRTWTTLIVLQVTVVVALLPLAAATAWWEVRGSAASMAVDTDRFIVFGLVEADEAVRTELSRRIEADPDVLGHAYGWGFPGGYGGRVGFQRQEDAGVIWEGLTVRTALVDRRFLETVGAVVEAGRAFHPSDWDEGAPLVGLINRAFADRYFGGGDAVGQRIQYAESDGSFTDADDDLWVEVVGVVQNLHVNRVAPELVEPRIYRPLLNGEGPPGINGFIKTAGGDPSELVARLRSYVVDIDPKLSARFIPLAEVFRQGQFAIRLAALIMGLSILAVTLLSAAGIYAMMSFAVSRRRHEIGIRTALGAQPALLVREVFGRALGQIVLGVGLGVSAAVALDRLADGQLLHGLGSLLLPSMVTLISVVALLAATGPARRGLTIPPAEALSAE